MKIHNLRTGFEAPGEFATLDDYPRAACISCPECGAEPGRPCSVLEPGEKYGTELSAYIHIKRAWATQQGDDYTVGYDDKDLFKWQANYPDGVYYRLMIDQQGELAIACVQDFDEQDYEQRRSLSPPLPEPACEVLRSRLINWKAGGPA